MSIQEREAPCPSGCAGDREPLLYSAQGDDLPSAGLVEAMGDGEDGAVFGSGLKGADDLALVMK